MMDQMDIRQSMDGKHCFAILLLSFFLLVYILPLGARYLMVPDETRYAEIPREMIATGNLVVPHLDGLRYFEKPVLGYWVHAGSLWLFGENRFAVRFPSALSVGLSCLLIFLLASGLGRPWRQRQGGLAAVLAAFIYLSCLEVFGIGVTAVLDSLFSLFLTATITTFFIATEAAPGSRRETWFLLLSGLMCALAFLTKGFLALAVPVLALAPYLAWQRRFGDLLRMSWLPILVAVLVSLPWGIAIYLKAPDFWHYFFWNEHVRRFLAKNAQHKKSFWFYFLAAPGAYFPWSFLLPAAAPAMGAELKGAGPQVRLMKMSLCWLVLPFLFFSCSDGKLLTYILPCFPPFAILMAFALCRILEGGRRRSVLLQWGIAGTAVLFGLVLIVFVGIQSIGYNGMHPYARLWKAILAVTCLLLCLLCCLWAFKSRRGVVKAIAFGLAPFCLYVTAPFIVPGRLLAINSPGLLLAQHRREVAANDIVISDETTVTAACWYFHRSDIYVLGEPDELAFGLRYPDAAGRSLDVAQAAALIRRNPGRVVLVARGKHMAQWKSRLPKPVYRVNNGPSGYVFWRY